MLKLAVLVSGSGTNLQAIIDRIEDGSVRNAKIEVVISNNPNAYALTRAKNHGICARCISPKSFETREAFNDALLEALTEAGIDLVVLAGFMVVVPPAIISKFRNTAQATDITHSSGTDIPATIKLCIGKSGKSRFFHVLKLFRYISVTDRPILISLSTGVTSPL